MRVAKALCLFVILSMALSIVTDGYGGDVAVNMLVSTAIGGIGGLIALEVFWS